MAIEPVPAQANFPKIEVEVLDLWQKESTFQKSLEKTKNLPPYIFYDGPPFATGLPHYGHILTSYIKDTVPRYFTMKGHFVDRTWGWDCHGLPVEFEVEKMLGVSGKTQIEEIGVGKFNQECKSIVLRYADEWETIINRLGRWVDFKRQYRTMDLSYMESVMWVFAELYKKSLIYEDYRVIAYCTRCQTPLSNFETGLDDSFRSKEDPSATVHFRDLKDPSTSYLAWTTTPWTLPSNAALAVNPELEYSLVKTASGEQVWIASERIKSYEQHFEGASVINKATGKALVGNKYTPLFPYFAETKNAFQILAGDFVDLSTGTGIVHMAPSFGEDDYNLCKKNGIAGPDPLTPDGVFKDVVSDFKGKHVFDANKDILNHLKNKGLLFHRENFHHNYPHCWRCDTPLIYRAISSWFVKVTDYREQMLKDNEQINWVPAHIKHGRFGQWLEGARDWALSRNRYWGSPIPAWKCEQCKSCYVPSSLSELGAKCGQKVTDLHRPACDRLTWKCETKGCTGEFRRVPEVLDCWFESGAMPYAQVHYPFEAQASFKNNFPASFIVEYINQTRGWFYTLVAESSALMKQPPFKTSMCHGVILAEDGRKMSKRLKNFPDPMEVVSNHGSDALRIYLLSSPVVRGLDIRFSERGVREAARHYIIPLWNSFHFYTAYAHLMAGYKPETIQTTSALADRHVLSELETLRQRVEESAESYDLPKCYQLLLEFIELLSTWYIRNNRSRFWASELDTDSKAAFNTLYTVLTEFTKIAAPFIPFISEFIHRRLTGVSVHLADWPKPVDSRVDRALEQEMFASRKIIEGVRKIRERSSINLRQPLLFVKVSGISAQALKRNEELIKSQANVKEVIFRESASEFSNAAVTLNFRELGPILKDKMGTVQKLAKDGQFELLPDGKLKVGDFSIEPEHFNLTWVPNVKGEEVYAEGGVVISLSTEIREDLRLEGVARDLNRLIQDGRKKLDLPYEARIRLGISATGDWGHALDKHRPWLLEQCLASEITDQLSSVALEVSDERGDLKISIDKVA